MAMVLFYERINWENFPSVVTPINEINLNKVDYAVKTLDERTVALDTAKAEKSVVLNTIQDWSLDEKTGIITITKVNGDVLKFDLNIEKIPVKFELSEDGILTMTTDDGSKFTADIGSMIPVLAFESSDTISFTSNKREEISANHTFEEPYTGILYVTMPYTEAILGMQVELTPYSEDGMDVVTEIKTYNSSGGVIDIPVENIKSIRVTGNYELVEVLNTNAIKTVYKASVKDGSIKDKHLESNYLAKIKTQAESAELSATASAESAKESKSYAIGGTGTREGEDTDNAKYYAEKAKENIEPVMNAVSDISLNRQTLGYVKKNLLKITATTQTINGMTIIVNDDGSMVFNGTATKITEVAIGSVGLNGDFILSGAPEGSEYLTYKLFVRNSLNEVICRDYENDGMFSVSDTVTVYVNVNSGITLDNLTFYPMLRSSDVEDDTFEPYIDDVDTRLKALTPVANLITTVAGKPLDAIMGKELNDKILAVDGKIIFSETEPTTVEAGKIVMVYE